MSGHFSHLCMQIDTCFLCMYMIGPNVCMCAYTYEHTHIYIVCISSSSDILVLEESAAAMTSMSGMLVSKKSAISCCF